MIRAHESARACRPRRGAGCSAASLALLVKVLVASLIVGTILAHFGITTDELIRPPAFHPSASRTWRAQGFAWALPNLLLGSLVIVPVWFLLYLFRPPGESRD